MEDRSHEVLALAIVFMIVSCSAMALRVYVRGFMIKAIGTDDYTMLSAQAFFMGYMACQIGGVRYGTGRRIADLERDDAQHALKYWYFCEVFYAPATTMLKVSVGFFLLRITVNKLQVWIIRIFMAGSLIFGVFYTFLIIFQCHPVSFWWDLDPTHSGKCINATVFTACAYVISVLNSAADLTFAVLPMFIVWKTTMNTKTRAMVCVLLGVASIACIATLVRIPYLHTLNHYKGDFLYNTTEVAMLSTVEIGLGVTAACAATFRPLFQRWLGSGRGTSYATNPAQAVTARSLRLQAVNADRAGSNSGIKKTTQTMVTTVSRGDSWSKMPDLIRTESIEALNGPRTDRSSDDMV